MTKLREEDVMCAERLRSEDGRSVRSIARWMKVDESTLRYRLRRLRQGARDGRRGQQEVCGGFAAVIGAWMEAQEGAARPAPIRSLYEDLVVSHGYTGSYKAVVRYVRRRQPRPKIRPCRRVEVKAGSQGQVDWVERKVRLGAEGTLTKLYGFLLVLSHSRMWWLIWSRSQDLLSWIDCHNRALSALGGVPWTWRIDNLKTGVSKGAGPWARIHAGYASYARQMGALLIDPARVRTPTDKGKVERRARDVTAYLGLEHRHFEDLEDFQHWTDERTLERCRELRHPVKAKSIEDVWRSEKESLLALPANLPVPFDVQVTRCVSREGLIPFEGREYHVPFQWIDRDVQVRGGAGVVEILGDHEVLAVYPRHTSDRRLLRQDFYEGEATENVAAPTPLGKVAREIVLDRTWTAQKRPIEDYVSALQGLQP